MQQASNSKNKSEKKSSKLAGKGSYGCVFRPRFSCLENDKETKLKDIEKSRDLISKIFEDESEILYEKKAQENFVKKFNANSKYTAGFIDQCIINTKNLNANSKKNLELCPFSKQKNDQNQKQLLYEDGGADLNKLSKELKFFDIFPHMTSLFEGIVAMHDKKLIHNDIKPHNIVFNLKNKRMLYIDFGLINNYDDIFLPKDINLYYKPEYFVYPPEYTLFSKYIDNIQNTNNILFNVNTINTNKLDKNFDKYTRQLQNHYSYQLNKIINYSNNESITKTIKNFIHVKTSLNQRVNDTIEYKKYIDNKIKDYKKTNTSSNNYSVIHNIFKEQAHKICVYALGISIYEIFLNTLQKLDNMDVSSFFMNDKNLIYEGIPLLFDLLYNMTHSNPTKRYGPQEALLKYNEMQKKLNFTM